MATTRRPTWLAGLLQTAVTVHPGDVVQNNDAGNTLYRYIGSTPAVFDLSGNITATSPDFTDTTNWATDRRQDRPSLRVYGAECRDLARSQQHRLYQSRLLEAVSDRQPDPARAQRIGFQLHRGRRSHRSQRRSFQRYRLCHHDLDHYRRQRHGHRARSGDHQGQQRQHGDRRGRQRDRRRQRAFRQRDHRHQPDREFLRRACRLELDHQQSAGDRRRPVRPRHLDRCREHLRDRRHQCGGHQQRRQRLRRRARLQHDRLAGAKRAVQRRRRDPRRPDPRRALRHRQPGHGQGLRRRLLAGGDA